MKSSLNSKTQSAGTNVRAGATRTGKDWKSLIWKQRWLLLMALPGFLIVLVFNYFPMYGVLIAFEDYSVKKGVLGSEWVGVKNFMDFFQNRLFFANHTSNGVYWNGKEYVMGLYEEGYKDAVAFARKLYAEGLLDPEYISDDDEMLKSKELSDKTFIVMADWFTTPGEFTRLSSSGQVFCATLFPGNPKYGEEAWQEVQPVNTASINQFSGMAVNADTKDPEGVIEFLNHCFDDDIIRLLTWGIEGDSYDLDKDGNPQFVDEILNAPDPWSEADKYGMRASKNMRPGVILAEDSKAYVALAADDWLYYDGKVHQEPVEQSEYYLNLPYPDYPENPYVPPAFEEPVCTFDTDTTQENSQITTAYNTLRDEWEAALVSGTRSMDEWDKYMKEIKNVADIDKLLDNYNKAAKEYFKRSEK